MPRRPPNATHKIWGWPPQSVTPAQLSFQARKAVRVQRLRLRQNACGDATSGFARSEASTRVCTSIDGQSPRSGGHKRLPSTAVVLRVQLVPALDVALPNVVDTAFSIVGIPVQLFNTAIAGLTVLATPVIVLCVVADV